MHPLFDWCDLGQEYLCDDCHTDTDEADEDIEDTDDEPCRVCLEQGCRGGCID